MSGPLISQRAPMYPESVRWRTSTGWTPRLAGNALPVSLSPISDVGSLCLPGIRIGLKAFIEPLPPLANVRVFVVGPLCLDPPSQAGPRSTDPAPDHPVEHVEVNDAFVDHGAPHLARAVHCKSGVKHGRVATDDLRISIGGEVEHAVHRATHLLRLDSSDDIYRRVISPVPRGVTELRKTEPDPQDDRQGDDDVQGRRQIQGEGLACHLRSIYQGSRERLG